MKVKEIQVSQRKKKNTKIPNQLSQAELLKLRELNDRKTMAELSGLTPEQAERVNQSEERVFGRKGKNKGRELSGGETSMIEIAPENTDGTVTYLKYKDKRGNVRESRTQITSDKKLIDLNTGQTLKQLY